MARFDTVHPRRNTLGSSKDACEIKNVGGNMLPVITGPSFIYFFVPGDTSECDFYTFSLELLYVIGGMKRLSSAV